MKDMWKTAGWIFLVVAACAAVSILLSGCSAPAAGETPSGIVTDKTHRSAGYGCMGNAFTKGGGPGSGSCYQGDCWQLDLRTPSGQEREVCVTWEEYRDHDIGEQYPEPR